MKNEITIFISDGKWTVKILFENGASITSQYPKKEAINVYKKMKKQLCKKKNLKV